MFVRYNISTGRKEIMFKLPIIRKQRPEIIWGPGEKPIFKKYMFLQSVMRRQWTQIICHFGPTLKVLGLKHFLFKSACQLTMVIVVVFI